MTPEVRFWLHVDGDLHGQVAMDGDTLLAGRGEHCDVVVEDGTISRDHLEITRHGGAVVATDLGSRNGTELNGKRLEQPTRLKHGDTLVFGSARLQVVLPQVAGADETIATMSRTPTLTDEERAVAAALVAAYREPGALAPRPATRAEIAERVHLSERTVQRRIDALAGKLRLQPHAPRERAHLLAQRVLELGVDRP
jgi:predicted component of type VI protein secretion system